jgi:hypothetical protein
LEGNGHGLIEVQVLAAVMIKTDYCRKFKFREYHEVYWINLFLYINNNKQTMHCLPVPVIVVLTVKVVTKPLRILRFKENSFPEKLS